jgi:hypothetical protein
LLPIWILPAYFSHAVSKGAAGEIAELLNRDLELEDRPFQAKEVETRRADPKSAGHAAVQVLYKWSLECSKTPQNALL